jgi:flagellar biosynthesis protein FliQ
MDQRALFFIVAAGVAGVMIPVIDDELSYVPEIVAIVYVILAAASYLDWRTNKR